MKWMEFLARNIKDAKSLYGLKQESDHLFLSSSKHTLKITGSLEVRICFNSAKRTKTVSHITNFTVTFPGSVEIAEVSLPEVPVMRLNLENHLHDQVAPLSGKSHRQPAGLGESLF